MQLVHDVWSTNIILEDLSDSVWSSSFHSTCRPHIVRLDTTVSCPGGAVGIRFSSLCPAVTSIKMRERSPG